jgi:hypothetical protein
MVLSAKEKAESISQVSAMKLNESEEPTKRRQLKQRGQNQGLFFIAGINPEGT